MSNEEIIQAIAARADKDGDSFKVRVMRRPGPTIMPIGVALLEGAQVAHFASPETWLPKLCGGSGGAQSMFLVSAYHASEASMKLIAQPLTFHIPGEPRDVDPTVLKQSGWNGPTTLVWPESKDVKPATPAGYSFAQPSSVPSLGATTPQTIVSTGAAPTTGLQNDPLANERQKLEAERAMLQQQIREFERAQHLRELEEVKRENERAIREMESRILAARPTAPASDPTAAIFPLIQVMMAQQADSAKQQIALFTTLLERKTEDSPNTKIGLQMAESMGAMMKVMTESIQMATEAINGPREPVGMMVVKEVVKGLKSVGAGMAAAKIPAAKPPQGQLRAVPPPQMPAHAAPQPQHASQGHAPVMQAPQAPVPQVAEARTVVDQIESMIRSMQDPNQVAALFVASLQDPALDAELSSVGRNPVTLFENRLGDWADESEARGEYVGALAGALQAQLSAGGALVEDEEVEDAEVVESSVAAT